MPRENLVCRVVERGGIFRSRGVWCLSCIVGRALPPPWPSAPQYRFLVVTAFGLCVGAAYMPPAKRCLHRAYTGCMVCISHCRAGVNARRTDDFLIFIMCGGVKTPPYKSAGTDNFPGNPAWRTPLPGGIYASPTNKGIAYTNPKTLQQGKRPRAAYMRPLQTGRKENVYQTGTNHPADLPACERGRGFRTGARMSRTGVKEVSRKFF